MEQACAPKAICSVVWVKNCSAALTFDQDASDSVTADTTEAQGSIRNDGPSTILAMRWHTLAKFAQTASPKQPISGTPPNVILS